MLPMGRAQGAWRSQDPHLTLSCPARPMHHTATNNDQHQVLLREAGAHQHSRTPSTVDASAALVTHLGLPHPPLSSGDHQQWPAVLSQTGRHTGVAPFKGHGVGTFAVRDAECAHKWVSLRHCGNGRTGAALMGGARTWVVAVSPCSRRQRGNARTPTR